MKSFREFIFEGQEIHDAKFRKTAVTLFNKIKKYFVKNEDRASKIFQPGGNGSLIFNVGQVNKNYKDLTLVLLPSTTNVSKQTGSYKTTGGFGTGTADPNKKYIILSVLIDEHDITHLDTRLNRTQFVHEFIHYLDDKRTKGRASGSAKNLMATDDYDKYYDNPLEFNAYYQDGVDSIISLIDGFKRTMKNSPETADKIKKVIKVAVPLKFTKFLQRAKEFHFQDDFIAHLLPKWDRKLIKRLVSFHKTVVIPLHNEL